MTSNIHITLTMGHIIVLRIFLSLSLMKIICLWTLMNLYQNQYYDFSPILQMKKFKYFEGM